MTEGSERRIRFPSFDEGAYLGIYKEIRNGNEIVTDGTHGTNVGRNVGSIIGASVRNVSTSVDFSVKLGVGKSVPNSTASMTKAASHPLFSSQASYLHRSKPW